MLAASTGVDGYDERPTLDDERLATSCCATSTVVAEHAASRGVVVGLHPHVGTMVETGDETERVLAGSVIGPVRRHRSPASSAAPTR